jgi:rhomboid protease GluP
MAVWPEHLVEIGRFADEDLAHDYGLVVLSQGAGYWVAENDAETFSLLVESGYVERLRPQLELYERESKHWPPVQAEMPESHPGSYAAMTWVGVLLLAWLSQNSWPALKQWGMVSSHAIQSGEIYRAFTALFLHGDIGHLAGNLLFGAVFLHLVARHIGTLRAWLGPCLPGPPATSSTRRFI